MTEAIYRYYGKNPTLLDYHGGIDINWENYKHKIGGLDDVDLSQLYFTEVDLSNTIDNEHKSTIHPVLMVFESTITAEPKLAPRLSDIYEQNEQSQLADISYDIAEFINTSPETQYNLFDGNFVGDDSGSSNDSS